MTPLTDILKNSEFEAYPSLPYSRHGLGDATGTLTTSAYSIIFTFFPFYLPLSPPRISSPPLLFLGLYYLLYISWDVFWPLSCTDFFKHLGFIPHKLVECWFFFGLVFFFGLTFFLNLFFNWNIGALQCSVNFCCTVKWLSYMHIYILFNIFFHYDLSQDTEYGSLCYTVGSFFFFLIHGGILVIKWVFSLLFLPG